MIYDYHVNEKKNALKILVLIIYNSLCKKVVSFGKNHGFAECGLCMLLGC